MNKFLVIFHKNLHTLNQIRCEKDMKELLSQKKEEYFNIFDNYSRQIVISVQVLEVPIICALFPPSIQLLLDIAKCPPNFNALTYLHLKSTKCQVSAWQSVTKIEKM